MVTLLPFKLTASSINFLHSSILKGLFILSVFIACTIAADDYFIYDLDCEYNLFYNSWISGDMMIWLFNSTIFIIVIISNRTNPRDDDNDDSDDGDDDDFLHHHNCDNDDG